MAQARSVDGSEFIRGSGPWVSKDIRANGLKFHTVEYVPGGDGESATRPSTATAKAPHLLLFTHGFAENWRVFHHQLQYFAQQGYRAVAYDARGYGDTDKPPRGYDAWTLAADITGIVHALGYERAYIVASDDGGIPAWTFAALHPEMTLGLITYASPHPLALEHSILTGRSLRFLGYWLRQQVPFFSRQLLHKNHSAAVENRLRRFSSDVWKADPSFAQEAAYLRKSMDIPGVAGSVVKRHRWMFRSIMSFEGRRFRNALKTVTTQPTLCMYGTQDRLISHSAVKKSRTWTNNLVEVPINAGHFGYLENYAQVNTAIEKFVIQTQ